MATSKKPFKAYLLRLLTRKSPASFDIKQAKTILFFRYDRIGDMVVTTPVFRELKLANPNVTITVLASKINKGVLVNNPHIDVIETNYKNNLFSDLFTLLKLRMKNFDVCVEFDHSVVPHAIIRLKIIKPKAIISVKKDGRYGVKGNELTLYDFYTERPKSAHFRDIWLSVLSPLGVSAKSKKYELFLTREKEQCAINFLKGFHNKKIIGINVEGAIVDKRIKFDKLKEICEGLYKGNENIQIIILSTPENSHAISDQVIDMNLDYVIESYKTNTILDVSALIQQLDLIITPDTSIVHIASAFDKPVVSIHENNPDSYRLWRPTSTLNRTVFAKSKHGLYDYSVADVVRFGLDMLKKVEH
ncbi:glycosyl transferase family 9 [Candidatus Thioglobus autotrophicus]|jgi:ADP-heptose:LPS heptosyltransferase|uniref:Glycosyl transferase family 9 n=1 Tax=Candidatus Thioglobus autotrophicus TaxID=1705394 RepID=A0A0M3TTW1_9GAMM|nr:glycosyltransferase family 9 protein [Candidatus Thioglobus autotrophicus]ALE52191.1 glycosyl transferase family 9 [Candidatus Thioglobus autotrophicus]